MGHWGIGIFENDYAGNYLDSVIDRFVEDIRSRMQSIESGESRMIDDVGEYEIIPTLDILVTLCKHYDTYPATLQLETLQAWKSAYLQTLEDNVGSFGGRGKNVHRTLVVAIFNQLEQIIIDWENI